MLEIFQIIVLIFSAIIHEYMHGWAADQMGDPTAKNMGRLTLNPISHIDPIGSIIMPAFLILTNVGFVFGWAKPVPFNPYNLRDQKYGSAKVAVAGPLANLITAIFFGLVLRFSFVLGLSATIQSLLFIIVYINLLLMVFNLLPIPPLDGSKVIMPFLSYEWQIRMAKLEQHGMIILFLFLMFGFQIISPIIWVLFRLIVGTNFL